MSEHVIEPTLGATFLKRAKTTPEAIAILEEQRQWTFAELHYNAHYLANGFFALGLQRKDRVLILSTSRREAVELDLALLGVQAWTVFVPPHVSTTELKSLLRRLEPSALIIETEAGLGTLEELRSKEPALFVKVKATILMDNQVQKPVDRMGDSTLFSLAAFREFGAEQEARFKDRYETGLLSTSPEDVFTLCVSSGTTGARKAAQLTHENMISAIADIERAFTPYWDRDPERVASSLHPGYPLARVQEFAHFVFGWTRVFGSLEKLQPTILFASPQVLESIYRKAQESSLLKNLLPSGRTFVQLLSMLRENPKRALTSPLSLTPFFGPVLRYIVCGEGALGPAIDDFFADAGIALLEGYGLAETCSPVAFNTPEIFKKGSVGKPLPEVSVKIASHGEIWIKSKKTFVGYYGDSESTQAAFQDGWFKTGDLGHLDAEGFLFITDRKRDLLKLSTGETVSPLQIEKKMRGHPFIRDFFITGDGKPYLSAIVTLNPEALEAFAAEYQILHTTVDDLYRNPKVFSRVQSIIDDLNSGLRPFEAIRKFVISPRTFEAETGDLISARWVRRKNVEAKFEELLNRLYSDPS